MEEQIQELKKAIRSLDMRVTFLERREEIHVDSRQDYYRRCLEFSKQLAKRIRFLEAMYFLTAVALITHFIGHILAS